ncbi:P-loop NTPase fold protein [Streptomyces sp. NPDC005181]|uniref:KAP family P-loop NTPase fold protein n=1 Tax=Streptomyces sp. NPDC005181 TaxID=3156869 RepID=UPI0033ABCB85
MALFSEIRAALPKEEQWSEARQKIGGFGQAISPLGKLTALAGLDSESLIKAISDRVSGDTSVSAAKRKAEDALRKAGSPVLVVMDDLDRLTPDELLLVFKLVRLVGHLPNVYYLISFDEQTLLDVLRRSELVGDSEPRAREFLEMIVQVRLDLPAFRERDADVLVDRSLTAVLRSHELTMTPVEQRRFSEAYFRHLQGRPACAHLERSSGSSARSMPPSAHSPETWISSTSCSSPLCAPASPASTGSSGGIAPNSPAPVSIRRPGGTNSLANALIDGAPGSAKQASPKSICKACSA